MKRVLPGGLGGVKCLWRIRVGCNKLCVRASTLGSLADPSWNRSAYWGLRTGFCVFFSLSQKRSPHHFGGLLVFYTDCLPPTTMFAGFGWRNQSKPCEKKWHSKSSNSERQALLLRRTGTKTPRYQVRRGGHKGFIFSSWNLVSFRLCGRHFCIHFQIFKFSNPQIISIIIL